MNPGGSVRHIWQSSIGGAVTPSGHGVALVYQVAPAQALGFGKGEPFSQTRWDFT